MHQKRIVALPGSLRSQSSSNVVIEIIRQIIPNDIQFQVFDGIGTLPHFNDSREVPDAVSRFRGILSQADAVLICTPEYAFGVPGSLKNALDWTVSSGEFVNKPCALITASSQGEKGHASLLQTLTALSADVPEERQLLISFIRAKLDGTTFKNIEDLEQVRAVVDCLVAAIR